MSEMPKTFTPMLGLIVEDAPSALSQRQAAVREAATLELTVIVPARNEERRLPGCLCTLLSQDEEQFRLGRDWELLMVDDASTDATREAMLEAATGRESVYVLETPTLDAKLFTGKSAACWFAAEKARGRWLLFTDADTLHEPRDLMHALYEAKKHGVAMLSYSPRQIVKGFWQRALMPLIFSELASVYKMQDINDPTKKIAAANGQFLFVEREAYFAVGGHRALGRNVLEDVQLACNIKSSKRALRFRYAPDAVSTRMYEGFTDMCAGWTKNLSLLFPHAIGLAFWRALDVVLLLLPLVVVVYPLLVAWQEVAILLLWLRTLLRFYTRVRRSNFPWQDVAISPLGLPLFVVLLLWSWASHKLFRSVRWKGREYQP